MTGSLGFSYFWTQSSVEGSNGGGPFADSKNFSDAGFSTAWGGGLYIPIGIGKSSFSIDIGAQVHKNSDIQYLTKNSIVLVSATAPPVITPVRSSADFVTYRLGVSLPLHYLK